MAITVAKRAWMAAVIDLRGRVVYKNNKTRTQNNQVTLYVESVQLPVIERLNEYTGGNAEVKTHKRSSADGWFRHGCDEHCPTAHIHVQGGDFLPSARWTISGCAMAVVLMNLQPYMIQDKGMTEAISYGMENMKLWGQGATATIAALRRLHGLGWPMPPIIEETRPDLFIKIRKGKGSAYADAEERSAQEALSQVPGVQVVPGAGAS